MPTPIKPVSSPEWTVGNPNFGTVTVEPTSGKKLTGWTPNEKPPAEYMNWLFYNLGDWRRYFEEITDDLKTQYDTLVASLTAQIVKHVTPTGVVDGVNAAFVLPGIPVSQDAIWVNVNGTVLKKNEFSLAGATITLLDVPALGQDIDVLYIEEIGVSAPVSGGGGGGGSGPAPYYHTLTGGEISAKELTLPYLPTTPSRVSVDVIGGTGCVYDFSGAGASSTTDFYVQVNKLIWANKRLDGALAAGDQVRITYFP